MEIKSIEAYRPGPLTYRHRGEVYSLPHPSTMPVERIMLALHLQTLPEIPLRMEIWRTRLLFERWVAHHDLLPLQQAQRLAFLVERYRGALEYDLRRHLGEDLDALWRDRRWRRLLNYIDHLPRESWYTEAVSNDEEHAEMIVKALAEREDDPEPYHPPMRTWTQESALLVELLDAVRRLAHITMVANGAKGVQPPAPAPRPLSALDKAQRAAEHTRKRRKHNALVARVLPHRAAKDD